jgi:spermidine synthase
MNRFYTVEFFRRVRQHLATGGLLTFTVPGGEAMIGPTHLGLLGSVERTLGQVFPQIAILPGGRVRLLAADETAEIVLQPSLLAERIRQRQLDLVYLGEDTLGDALNPLKLDYLREILGGLREPRINRDFSPICYYHGLIFAAAEWHPWLQRIVTAAAAIRPLHLGIGLVAAGVLIVLFFWIGRLRYRTAVSASIFVQGVWGMVLQLVLILAFQILEGFAYLQLALIIALFMAGLALGAMWVAWARRAWQGESPAVRWFALAQAGVTSFPLVLLLFLSPVCETMREALSPVAASWVFSVVSLLAGILGGAHFSLAALAMAVTGVPAARTGGWLYAVDLAGAAGGVFVASLLVLPLYGVSGTLLLLSAISFVCLLAVLRQPVRAGVIP